MITFCKTPKQHAVVAGLCACSPFWEGLGDLPVAGMIMHMHQSLGAHDYVKAIKIGIFCDMLSHLREEKLAGRYLLL